MFSSNRTHAFAIALIAVLLYLSSAAITWRGIGDWDATYYITAAFQWYENGAQLGENHWHLRHPMVLPIAGSFAVLSPSELAATLPNLIYAIALIVVSALWGARFLGLGVGACFALLVATSPSLVLQPLEIEVRGPELFFSVTALWLLTTALDHHDGAKRLFLAGLFAGAAWLCREVAGYLLPTFVLAALLFATKSQRLSAAVIPAVSFGIVILAEITLYWFASGDPLYRYRIDLGHADNRSGTEFAPLFNQSEQQETSPIEPLVQHLTEPLLQHLTEPTTGPMIVIAGLALLIVSIGFRSISISARRALGVFSIGTAMSYLLSSIVLNLEKPNYFPLLSYWALLLISIAIGLVWQWGHRRLPALTMVSLLVAGPLFAGLGERYEIDYYRYAVSIAKTEEDPLVTPFRVRERATLLLRLEGWSQLEAEREFASHETPNGGTVALRPGLQYLEGDFVLGDEWVPVEEWRPSDLVWQHRLLQGFEGTIPLPTQLERLITPPPAVLFGLIEADAQ